MEHFVRVELRVKRTWVEIIIFMPRIMLGSGTSWFGVSKIALREMK
jgi:hypothetical protein